MSGLIDNYDEFDKRLDEELDAFIEDVDNGYERAGFEIESNINSEYRCMGIKEEGGKIIWYKNKINIDDTEYEGSCILCTKEELLNKSNMDIERLISSARYYNLREVED